MSDEGDYTRGGTIMRYVVVGASAAGISAVSELRRLDKECSIILISKDEAIYSRCILHHYMEGLRDLKQLSFVEENFIEKNKVEWKKGIAATGIDTKEKVVIVSTGERIPFDKLLIATGSKTFFPPIQNIDANNILGLHNFDDCLKIMESAAKAENIVVMGGGLIGIDAVTGLLHSKKNISVIETKKHMLPLQLDEASSGTYETAFSNYGVNQYYNLGIKDIKIDDKKNIKSIVLTDERELLCDMLIVTAGVRANIDFLKNSDILLDKFGLVIDEYGRTSVDNIFGAGDVTGKNPIWPVAVKEGIVAANNMMGIKRKLTDFFASKSTMNFLGIPTMSLGNNEPSDESYKVEIEIDKKGNYKKIIHKDGKIYGAILQGDLSYAGILTQIIANKIDISKVKKSIFKIDYSDFFNIKDNFEFTY